MSALHVARRELLAFFAAPLGWVSLAIVQGVLGWQFVVQVWTFERLAPQIAALPDAPGITAIAVAPIYKSAAAVLMMVMPILTMGLISGERRAGTLPLLLSSPISTASIAIGKFLGVAMVATAMTAGASTFALSLVGSTGLDLGLTASCALAVLLSSLGYAAVGLYLSSLTASPAAAAAMTYGVLVGLHLLSGTAGEGTAAGVARWLSFGTHADPLLRGIVDSRDLIYFAVVVVTCLALTVRRLEADRLTA